MDSIEIQEIFTGTPYTLEASTASRQRFAALLNRSRATQTWSKRIFSRISTEASELLGPFLEAIRSELVTESNRIEGYHWSLNAAREVIFTNKELLSGPVHGILTTLRNDPRVYEVLGLYKAHTLADEWDIDGELPRQYEIRALHGIIMGNHASAGNYKQVENRISQSSHVPAAPIDVPKQMSALVTWWHGYSGDPILGACILHAWLAHIHPFEDGNGRLSRLLANLNLTRHQYPPLILKSDSDRGRYLDSLRESDDGNILPLYELFISVIRRTAKIMDSEAYVRDLIENRLLTPLHTKYQMWTTVLKEFFIQVRMGLEAAGWHVQDMGIPSIESFKLLCDHDQDGNCWFFKVFDKNGWSRLLFWFGYNTEIMQQTLHDEQVKFPSIFLSVKNNDFREEKPYTWLTQHDSLPIEIILQAAQHEPVLYCTSFSTDPMELERATQRLVVAVAELSPQEVYYDSEEYSEIPQVSIEIVELIEQAASELSDILKAQVNKANGA